MNTLSLVTVIVSLAAIFAFCAWVIKRHFIDRRWLHDGSRFIGRNVYSRWQNADEQERIEYVQYVKEDERDETDSAEPLKFEGDDKVGRVPTRRRRGETRRRDERQIDIATAP